MTEKKTFKPPVDWDLIESHYRAGILTNVQLVVLTFTAAMSGCGA